MVWGGWAGISEKLKVKSEKLWCRLRRRCLWLKTHIYHEGREGFGECVMLCWLGEIGWDDVGVGEVREVFCLTWVGGIGILVGR